MRSFCRKVTPLKRFCLMDAGRVLLRWIRPLFSHQPVSPSTRRSCPARGGGVIQCGQGIILDHCTQHFACDIWSPRTVSEATPTRYHFLSSSSGTGVGGTSGSGGGGTSTLSRSLLELQPTRLPSILRIFSQSPSAVRRSFPRSRQSRSFPTCLAVNMGSSKTCVDVLMTRYNSLSTGGGEGSCRCIADIQQKLHPIRLAFEFLTFNQVLWRLRQPPPQLNCRDLFLSKDMTTPDQCGLSGKGKQ